jgi:hypothetical protein
MIVPSSESNSPRRAAIPEDICIKYSQISRRNYSSLIEKK